MANAGDKTDWRELREFAAVDLTRSFVLSWDLAADTLLIDIDLYLTAEHPFYERPRPAEKVCIRPSVIEFPFCDAIESDRAVSGGGSLAPIAEIGAGAITALTRLADGRYEIRGDFGIVHIDAERPILRLKGS